MGVLIIHRGDYPPRARTALACLEMLAAIDSPDTPPDSVVPAQGRDLGREERMLRKAACRALWRYMDGEDDLDATTLPVLLIDGEEDEEALEIELEGEEDEDETADPPVLEAPEG